MTKPSKTTSPRGNHVSDLFDITVCDIKDPKEQWSRSRFRNQRDSVFYGHLVPSTQVWVFVEDACVQSASFICIPRCAMRAVVLHQYGGPEKLKFEDNVPEPQISGNTV